MVTLIANLWRHVARGNSFPVVGVGMASQRLIVANSQHRNQDWNSTVSKTSKTSFALPTIIYHTTYVHIKVLLHRAVIVPVFRGKWIDIKLLHLTQRKVTEE